MTKGVKPATPNKHLTNKQVPSHITVLLEEAVAALNIVADGVYVDGTYGRGGHSQLILSMLGLPGRLIALDRDVAAIRCAQTVTDKRFEIIHAHFSQTQAVLNRLGVSQVDGILLDLGISSPQIDEGERGFSFRHDGPLDMRMDQTTGQTVGHWLNEVTEQQLAEVIKTYGEERFAKQIARAVIAERQQGRAIFTTKRLAELVANVVPKFEAGQHPATRTFQALRIYINQELEELTKVLAQCVDLLKPGGRLAVISFHSLEDRLVKRFMQAESNRDHLPANFPIRAHELPQPRMRSLGKVIKPSSQEVLANPRARSAVLRVAERTQSSVT